MSIPKIILQINDYNPPDYVIKSIQLHTPNWEYFFFNETTAIHYLENNILQDYTNCIHFFKNLNNIFARIDFFRYYFLWINGGVYLNSYTMLVKNIDDILDKCCFFSSKISEKNTLYNGFIGISKHNIIIEKCLKYMYELGFETLNVMYKNNNRCMDTFLYNTLEDINNDIRYIFKYENKIIFLETVNNNIIEIRDDSYNLIALNYYETKVIPCSIDLKTQIRPEHKLNIGISLQLPENILEFFSNGFRLNVIYLGELLCKIGYNVYFIINDEQLKQWIKNPDYAIIFYDPSFNVISEYDIFSLGLDLVIVSGYIFEIPVFKTLKEMKVKIILTVFGYEHVTNYSYIFNQNTKIDLPINLIIPFSIFDKIWCLPHQMNTNKYLLETYYKCEVIESPFIWSPCVLQSLNLMNNSFLYIKKTENKNIVIFEPNINILKWYLPPVLVCENTYRNLNSKQKINHVYITNVLDKLDTSKVTNSVMSLDLFIDKKISFESRYQTHIFMKKKGDIVVSHQWELNFNYLYLDLAWWGWPIVHNGSFCKDIGYYYEGFNYEMGGKVLEDVILHHDENINEYIQKNRAAIDRYLPTNKSLQASYKKLIENLFEK